MGDTSIKSNLLCVRVLCEHWNPERLRNCADWQIDKYCGFYQNQLKRFIAKPAGYTSVEPKPLSMVNKPVHYQFTEGLEVIDVIEIATKKNVKDSVQAGLYWQVLKYLLRCGCKGKLLEDLRKAEFYLKRLIKEVRDAV